MMGPRFADFWLRETPPWCHQRRMVMRGAGAGTSLCGGSFSGRTGRRCWWSSQGSPVEAGAPSRGSLPVPPPQSLTACSWHGVTNGKHAQWCSCTSGFRATLDVSFLLTSTRKVWAAGRLGRLILGVRAGSWSAAVSAWWVRERVPSSVFFPFSLFTICLSSLLQSYSPWPPTN